MILSVSRRTDIPNYYSDWFYRRLQEGFVHVRNPINFQQVSKIPITSDVVDCIVFWTKNPEPMLSRLYELNGYPYYFQFTLNAYGKDIEPMLPSKGKVLINTFKHLSKMIGREKVIWRYDPILINDKYTAEYHFRYFEKLAEKLCRFTECCTISFLDFYRCMKKQMEKLGVKILSENEQKEIASTLAEVAMRYQIKMNVCTEEFDLSEQKIMPAHCIDKDLIERITGYKLKSKKDRYQRKECGCISSIDIGMYDTCINSCTYCYANHHQDIEIKMRLHDPYSSLLYGHLVKGDRVSDRLVKSLRNIDIELFSN